MAITGLGQMFSNEAAHMGQRNAIANQGLAARLREKGDDFHMAVAKKRMLEDIDDGRVSVDDLQTQTPMLHEYFLRSKTGGQQGVNPAMFDRLSVFNKNVANPMRRAIQGVQSGTMDIGTGVVRTRPGAYDDEGKESITAQAYDKPIGKGSGSGSGDDLARNPSTFEFSKNFKNLADAAKPGFMDLLGTLNEKTEDGKYKFNYGVYKDNKGLFEKFGITDSDVEKTIKTEDDLLLMVAKSKLDEKSKKTLEKNIIAGIYNDTDSGKFNGKQIQSVQSLMNSMKDLGYEEDIIESFDKQGNEVTGLIEKALDYSNLDKNTIEMYKKYGDYGVTGVGVGKYKLYDSQKTASDVPVVAIGDKMHVVIDKTVDGKPERYMVPVEDFKSHLNEYRNVDPRSNNKIQTEYAERNRNIHKELDNFLGKFNGKKQTDEVKYLRTGAMGEAAKKYADTMEQRKNALYPVNNDAAKSFYAEDILKSMMGEEETYAGSWKRVLKDRWFGGDDEFRKYVKEHHPEWNTENGLNSTVDIEEVMDKNQRTILGDILSFGSDVAANAYTESFGYNYNFDKQIENLSDENKQRVSMIMNAEDLHDNHKALQIAKIAADDNYEKAKADIVKDPTIKKQIDRAKTTLTQLENSGVFPSNTEMSTGKKVTYDYSYLQPEVVYAKIEGEDMAEPIEIPIRLYSSKSIADGASQLYGELFNPGEAQRLSSMLTGRNIKGMLE